MKGSAFKLNNVATKSALKHGAAPEQITDKGDGKTLGHHGSRYSSEEYGKHLKDSSKGPKSTDIKWKSKEKRDAEMEAVPKMKSPAKQLTIDPEEVARQKEIQKQKEKEMFVKGEGSKKKRAKTYMGEKAAKHAIIKKGGKPSEFAKGGREGEKGKVTEYKKTGEGTYKKTTTKIKKGKGHVTTRKGKQKTKTISAKKAERQIKRKTKRYTKKGADVEN